MTSKPMVTRQEKGIMSAREAMLERLGFGELRQQAAVRLGEALNHQDLRGVALPAVRIVMDTLPRDDHGNSQRAGQPIVLNVITAPWMAELRPAKSSKPKAVASSSTQPDNAPLFPDAA